MIDFAALITLGYRVSKMLVYCHEELDAIANSQSMRAAQGAGLTSPAGKLAKMTMKSIAG